mmetsp:Transcript_24014/g.54160  ORF Transcript_24014/g.54160 Transcript_24014/m.54160 type:complete len:430 (-) Transcript_24014:114-1403(-)
MDGGGAYYQAAPGTAMSVAGDTLQQVAYGTSPPPMPPSYGSGAGFPTVLYDASQPAAAYNGAVQASPGALAATAPATAAYSGAVPPPVAAPPEPVYYPAAQYTAAATLDTTTVASPFGAGLATWQQTQPAPAGATSWVAAEDCGPFFSCPSSPSAAPGGPGAAAIGARQGEVYVQHVKDASRFRSIPKDRVRRAYQNDERLGGGAGGGGTGFAQQGEVAADSGKFTRAALCRRLDRDAVQLDASDADICELLLAGRQCEASAAVFFFASQALLAGLSLTLGLLLFGASSKDIGGEAELGLDEALAVLQPGIGSFALALGEVSLVGSILRAAWALRDMEDRGKIVPGLRASVRLLGRPLLEMLVNGAYVFACLISSRGDVFLLAAGPASSPPGTLLAIRALLSLLALALVLPDAWDPFRLGSPGSSQDRW